MTKNIGKSIKTRLLNLAKEEKQDYMKVLVRYQHERLLFRISASPYKSHFLLKGSSLLYALDGFKARPTIDIDLLGERISNDGVHRTVTLRRDSVTRFFPRVYLSTNQRQAPSADACPLFINVVCMTLTSQWSVLTTSCFPANARKGNNTIKNKNRKIDLAFMIEVIYYTDSQPHRHLSGYHRDKLQEGPLQESSTSP